MTRNQDIVDVQNIIIGAGYPLPRYGADGDWNLNGETAVALRQMAADAQAFRNGGVVVAVVAPVASVVGRLDPNAFRAWAPQAVPQTLEAIEAAIEATPDLQNLKVLEDWLGQMFVESQGFSVLTENLNYSVDALISKFGRHRISIADARKYGRIKGVQPANQEMIANIIYGGAWGLKNLGNIHPGDGWRFRGSGLKQITGRRNTEASGFTPEQLRTDIFASAIAAAQFFVSHGCVGPALRGDIKEVTRLVNGGQNGLAERITATGQARKVIR